jgi:hypothetical protein
MLIKRRILVFTFFILISLSYISALRISPAKINFNFVPNLEQKMEFIANSYGAHELEIFVEGDLEEYITLDKNRLPKEGGTFVVTLKLPSEIEIPGRKATFIGVKEIVDEELAAGAVVVTVAIKAGIYVDVAYPGKYLETSLSSQDVNLNEPVTFNLNIISRGDNQVSFSPKIEIYSETEELLDTLEFTDRVMNSGERLELKKIWDSTGYSRGNYYALSKIDYGDRIAESKGNFRIGDLIIEITNYTNKIIRGGIKPFLIEIESGWNDKIDGAYAEIFLNNETKLNLLSFKTSPIDLEPWAQKSIMGYFDTDQLSLGKYVAKITVNYHGKNVEKSISKNVEIEIVEEEKFNYFLIGGIIFGGIAALVIIFLIIKMVFFKHGKKRK